jgi:uncharacterized protein YlxP (DUF503 family)
VFVGVLQVELSIPGAFSLKDKRHVLKGLLDRLRRDFAVTAAEVERQDVWNIAKSRDATVADSQIEVF